MSAKDEGFLSRWARRKVEARAAPAREPAPDAPAAPAPEPVAPTNVAAASSEAAPAPLPALESLTPHSDFAPFMRADVDPALKGEALKRLFSDPALYPMDGLDIYIDDYSKPDPLPEGWLEKLNQLANLHGEPPAAEAQAPPAAQGEASAQGVIPAADLSGQSAPQPPSSGAVDTSDIAAPPAGSMNRGAT